MINEVIDNMFKFDVEFNPGDSEERHLALTHIYKNGPKFNLGSGKCIRLINCIVELDENGNLDTFRATAFADGFFESELSKVDRVILGEYKNTRWKYDSFRDIYSEWPKERRAQMRAIEKVKARTKKPLIETIRFLAKFVIERHVALPDRSGDEARAKERREQERLDKRMEQLRAELERMRRTVGKSFNESRMLLRMLVNETINRYLFKNTRRSVSLRENRLRGIIRNVVSRTLMEQRPPKKVDYDKFENWGPDEFVSWEEYQDYCNHSGDWMYKNMLKCEELGIPPEERCNLCQRPLKNGYKTAYYTTADNGVSLFFNNPKEGSKEVKIGRTCLRALERAHHDKYNNYND